LAASATAREDRLLSADSPGREHLAGLLDAWLMVARVAVAELESETSVTIVNAGDQVQKHPGVTVLEAASKRVEALVVLLDRFAVGGDGGLGAGVDDAPPPAFRVVD
jgi:hypothetical protein